MIKFDSTYSDYVETQDPAYPGGKAVNATTTESTEGTPLLADWMNDINGARQALFLEAFGDINKVSGRPDNVQESDVLKSIKNIIKKMSPGLASQGDYTDKKPTQGIGLVKTVNYRPNGTECQKNEPWAASPNWVYNLLTGNAAEDVNNAVAAAIRKLVSGGVKYIDFTNETGFIEWDNGFKIAAVSFLIEGDWDITVGRRFYFPITFQKKPIYLSSFVEFGGEYAGIRASDIRTYFRLLDLTSFMVFSDLEEPGLYKKCCLFVFGV